MQGFGKGNTATGRDSWQDLKKEEELKGLKAELAALDRKIQLELAPPQEQDTAEKHETKNIETEQSIVGKQARSVCRL